MSQQQPLAPTTPGDAALRSWGSEEIAQAMHGRSLVRDGVREAAREGAREGAATLDRPAPSSLDDTPTLEIPRQAAAGRHVLGEADREQFQRQWEQVQVGFVDEPAAAVPAADRLVAAVAARFCQQLDDERSALAAGAASSASPPTEDLRLTLQGYRQLMQRLLST